MGCKNPPESPNIPDRGGDSSGTDSESDSESEGGTPPIPTRPGRRLRRLSTYEDAEAIMDLEGDRVGSARQ